MLEEMAWKEAGHGMHQLPETRNQSEATSLFVSIILYRFLLSWLPK